MQRKLPPLNALRAFEAAGRHLSFTKAAQELSVTPAAVSHQVKGLEDYLGLTLFLRNNRVLELSDVGRACLPGLTESFDRLTQAVAVAERRRERRVLTVSTAPAFGAKWLLPRLERFYRQHPDIDVRLDATNRKVDLLREDVDLAVRFGSGVYPGLDVTCLLSERITAACSPALLKGSRPLLTPQDLKGHTLLHVEDSITSPTAGYPDWCMWLRAAQVHDVDPERGPVFNQTELAVEAAIEGHGVALVGDVLVDDDVAAGRLVKPFVLSFALEFTYHIVHIPGSDATHRVAAFRSWLLQEAEQYAVEQQKLRCEHEPWLEPPKS